jgi:hypothetical protein
MILFLGKLHFLPPLCHASVYSGVFRGSLLFGDKSESVVAVPSGSQLGVGTEELESTYGNDATLAQDALSSRITRS